MTLIQPMIITSRLLPGVQVGDATVSIEMLDRQSFGRAVYRYHIDGPDIQHTAEDLYSGVGGGTLQHGLESLLSFLGAAAESYEYEGMDGENADMFPEQVTKWAHENSDELSILQCELMENKHLITE